MKRKPQKYKDLKNIVLVDIHRSVTAPSGQIRYTPTEQPKRGSDFPIQDTVKRLPVRDSLVAAFLKLGDSPKRPDDRILSIAKKYGPLRGPGVTTETIDDWWNYAKLAGSINRVWNHAKHGTRPVQEDMDALAKWNSSPLNNEDARRSVSLAASELMSKFSRLSGKAKREAVCGALSLWLKRGGFDSDVDYDEGRLLITTTPRSILAVLGLQLLGRLGRLSLPLHLTKKCALCPREFQGDRRTKYCEKCRSRGEPVKVAMRKYREGLRAERGVATRSR
jgi:hypothetical protein